MVQIDNKKMWELILSNHPNEQDWINICDIKLALADQGLKYNRDKGIVEISPATEEEIPHEPKFKEGEWVVFNNRHDSVYQIEKIENYEYTLRHTLGGSMPLPFSHESSIRLWDIAKDAKDGDVLYSPKGLGVETISIFHEMADVEYVGLCGKSHITLRTAENELVEGGLGLVWLPRQIDPIYPATKEQKELLFNAMFEAGYLWDLDNHKLVKKPNPIDILITKHPADGLPIVPQPEFDNTNGTNTIKVDEEEELTEFEKALFRTFFVTWNRGGYYPTEIVKLHAQELLSVAEKEIRKKIVCEINVDKMVNDV